MPLKENDFVQYIGNNPFHKNKFGFIKILYLGRYFFRCLDGFEFFIYDLKDIRFGTKKERNQNKAYWE